MQEIVGSHGVKQWLIGRQWGEIPLAFTFDEALALYLGQKSLQPLAGTMIAEAAGRAFQKIRASFGPRVVRYLDKMRGLFRETAFGVTDYGPHAEILDRLMVAIEERRVVFIAYRSQRATEPVTYDIHPYRITRHQGSLYLIGHKVDDGQLRTWRVDRIQGSTLDTVSFTVPPDLDLDERFGGSLGIYEGTDQVTVKIRFLPPAARFVSEKRWHASQRLTTQRDGSLLAEFQLSSTAEVKPWVLGFGKSAEVLEPAELRHELEEELHDMLRIYRPDTERTTSPVPAPSGRG